MRKGDAEVLHVLTDISSEVLKTTTFSHILFLICFCLIVYGAIRTKRSVIGFLFGSLTFKRSRKTDKKK